MREELVVRHLDGDRFAVDVRGHTLLVDQPTEAGGADIEIALAAEAVALT